jgi:hypothetical protein
MKVFSSDHNNLFLAISSPDHSAVGCRVAIHIDDTVAKTVLE